MPEALLKTIIFPVAGLGTRFLPATKVCRKELLPIVDKPLIQYAAEEATEAGFTHIIFIVKKGEKSISDYFSESMDLNAKLATTKTQEEVDALTKTSSCNVICTYVEQPEALGLGHAIWCARSFIKENHFAVLLPDDLIDGGLDGSCLSQMRKYYEQNQHGVIGVEQISPLETKKYGVVGTEDLSAKVSRITEIVEKPRVQDAPSLMGVVGRYILPIEIMSVIESTRRGVAEEIQITDAIASILDRHRINAFRFEGVRYDCGSKLGYLQANVAYAMKNSEVGDEFSAWLKEEVSGL